MYTTSEFMVFPSLGSFVEGYLLVCPKSHVASIAALDPDTLRRLERVLAIVKDVVRTAYGSTVVFEHGMSGCGRIDAGGCIEHAHLHVVPGIIDMRALLREYAPPQEIAWEDLPRWHGRSYLLGQSDADKTFISEVQDVLPSQYLRQLVARNLGVLDRWDWRDHPGLEQVESTVARLEMAFRNDAPIKVDSL